MKCRRLHAVTTAAALVLLTPAGVRAAPDGNPSGVSWGWATVILSLALGASLTGVAMAIDCPRDDLDRDCARWTSLGIWGGIGIASGGTVAGLLIIRAASPPPRVRVSFTVDRSQPGASMPHATLVYSF